MAITRERFGSLYKNSLAQNLEEVLKTIGRQEIKALYLGIYDRLADTEEAEAGSAIKGKDPLSLKNLRRVFEKQLDAEFSNIKVTSTGIEINLMNKSLLGYADNAPTGPANTVDMLAYYLEGVSGEHAFITIEQYKRGRKSGESRGDFGGRVGSGFMMSKQDYDREGWSKITGVPFADVRHPISNQKPFKGFDKLPEKIDFGKYIKIALEQTNQAIGVQ